MFGLASAFNRMNKTETLTFPQPNIHLPSSLHQTLFFLRKERSHGLVVDQQSDENEVFSLIELVNASPQGGLKEVTFNIKELFRVPKVKTVKMTPSHISHNLMMDWETVLLNQFEEEKVRGVCEFQHVVSVPPMEYGQVCPCLIEDWNFDRLTAESFHTFPEESNFKCIGFIDGKLIRHQFYIDKVNVFMEESGISGDGMKQIELEDWNGRSAMLIPLPCDSIEKKQYSLSGLIGDENIVHLFETKEKKFKRFQLKDLTLLSDFQLSGSTFISQRVIIREGSRLRVFLLVERCLYELRWRNGELTVIDHLIWLKQKVVELLRVGNSILISTDDGFFIYKPSSFEEKSKHGTLTPVTIPEGHDFENLIYNDDIGCIIDGLSLVKGETNYIVMEISVISQIEAKPIHAYYSEEVLIGNYMFKTHVPPKITDALQVTERPSFENTSFRGDAYYQCKHGRHNDMEIIAGFNCKENVKLQFALSPNYVELNPLDLADHLGAPVMISSFGDSLTLGYISDMVGKRRDSEYVSVKSGFATTSFGLYNMGTNFLAILSPRGEDSKPELVKKNEGDKEWEELSKKKQFRITSDEIRVCDFTTRGQVDIGNVESGLWSYNQKLEHELPAQLIAFNVNYRDTVNADIENDWNVPEETFSQKLENSYCVSEKTKEIRPLTDDWQVSVCGICIDGGIVGIFDASHCRDDNVFDYETRGFDLYFSTNYGLSLWSTTLQNMMDQQGYPLLMNVPFGVISRDAETGDGTYACLSKIHDGKVVAVKIIIQHSAYL